MINSISQKTARRLLLHAQLLDGRTRIRKGKEGIVQAVEHLGYVQIDTISVIERAHHHTLWTRVPGYNPRQLHDAQAKDRSIFEYWGHAASVLPMSDYRFYIPMMRSFLDPKAERKSKAFSVRQLKIEPDFHGAAGLILELSRALGDLARFNGCEKVVLENVEPKKLLVPLKKILALWEYG